VWVSVCICVWPGTDGHPLMDYVEYLGSRGALSSQRVSPAPHAYPVGHPDSSVSERKMQQVSKYASLLHERGIRCPSGAASQPPMAYQRASWLSRRILCRVAVVGLLLTTGATLIATMADRTSMASHSNEVPESIQLA
jgi:hypothetical protein